MRVLTPLVPSDRCSGYAVAAVQRFSALIEQERSHLGAARARLAASGSLSVDVAASLEAAVRSYTGSLGALRIQAALRRRGVVAAVAELTVTSVTPIFR